VVYQALGDPPVSFEFFSPTRVILASGPGAASHLLAAAGSGAATSARDPLVQSLASHVGGAPFFAVARADAIPADIYSSLGQSQAGSAVKNIQGVTLAGQPQADRLDLVLDARCDSMTSALQVSTLLGGLRVFGSLALSDPKTKKQLGKEQAALYEAILAQVQLHQQENWVRLALSVTPEMLESGGKHPVH
jgi:hypothetical protein